MTTPFPELPGLSFQTAVPPRTLDAALDDYGKDPDGILPTQMARLVWAYFNASAGRQKSIQRLALDPCLVVPSRAHLDPSPSRGLTPIARSTTDESARHPNLE